MSAMWPSCSANLLPIHARGPNPNGTEANGCRSFLAWLDLNHLSGMNCSALSKWASSVLIKSWCIAICTWKKKTKTLEQHPVPLRHQRPVVVPCNGQFLPRQGLCIRTGRCLWRRFWYFRGRQAGVCERRTEMCMVAQCFGIEQNIQDLVAVHRGLCIVPVCFPGYGFQVGHFADVRLGDFFAVSKGCFDFLVYPLLDFWMRSK